MLSGPIWKSVCFCYPSKRRVCGRRGTYFEGFERNRRRSSCGIKPVEISREEGCGLLEPKQCCYAYKVGLPA